MMAEKKIIDIEEIFYGGFTSGPTCSFDLIREDGAIAHISGELVKISRLNMAIPVTEYTIVLRQPVRPVRVAKEVSDGND